MSNDTTFVNPFTGSGYAINHVKELHKRPHLWRIEDRGVGWVSVATFSSDEEADLFNEWITALVNRQRGKEYYGDTQD